MLSAISPAKRVATRTISVPGGIWLSYTNADDPVATFTDVVGSPSHVIDMGRPETGVQRIRSDVFGGGRADQPQAPTVPARQSFTGGRSGFTSGLVKVGARDYDPATGRFISPDPVMDTSTPLSLNNYTYGLSNPVRFPDPTGLYVGAVIDDGGDGEVRPSVPKQESRADAQGVPVSSGGGRWAAPSGVTTAPTTVGSSGGKGQAGQPAARSWWDKTKSATSAAWGWVKDNPGELAHGVLDGCGLVPGIGEVCDGANALFYLAEGRDEMAALSAAAMVPFVGWGATGAKVGSKLTKIPGVEKGLTTFTDDVLSLKPGITSDTAAAPQTGGIGPVLKGQAGVAQAEQMLTTSGWKAEGSEVTVSAGGKRTRLDLLMRDPCGNLCFVEVKNGPHIKLTKNQAQAIPAIQTQGFVPHGANAHDAGLVLGQLHPPVRVLVVRLP